MNKYFFAAVFSLTVLGSKVSADPIRVAFMEAFWPDGRRARLGPGERFYHVAIQIKGSWYQSSPHKIVEPTKKLLLSGGMVLSRILEYELPEENPIDAALFVGQKFDYTFSWQNKKCTYCTKLVVEILNEAGLFNIKPTAMDFRGRHWRLSTDLKRKRKGWLGLSPDELYKELTKREFLIVYDRRTPGFEEQVKRSALRACRGFL